MIPAEQDILIRDMARQFAQERLKPFAADWDREHRFPAEALKEMADLGFLGMLVPEEWGGAQTGHLAYAMALEEIAAGDGACSTIMSVHNSVGCMPILKFGSQEQKQRFLQPLASGVMLGSDTDLCGPNRVRPTEREMAATFASFVSAFAESIQSGDGCGENADLFPTAMRDWAVNNADELSALTEYLEN